jgi:hypothetical protein
MPGGYLDGSSPLPPLLFHPAFSPDVRLKKNHLTSAWLLD